MLEIIEFTAERKNNESILLMWTLSPYALNSIFNIFRALNDADDFIEIMRGKASSYLDTDTKALESPQVQYKITCGNVESLVLKPYNVGDPYLLGLASDYLWQLKNVKNGTRCFAYCKAKAEQDCSECYDSVSKKRTKSTCSLCDGSGKITGYKGPVEMYVNFMKTIEIVDSTGDIEKKETAIQCWSANIPTLSRGDIIGRNNDKRYIVSRIPEYVRMNSRSNDEQFVVMQKFILQELARPNMIFDLEDVE